MKIYNNFLHNLGAISSGIVIVCDYDCDIHALQFFDKYIRDNIVIKPQIKISTVIQLVTCFGTYRPGRAILELFCDKGMWKGLEYQHNLVRIIPCFEQCNA